MAQKIGLEAVMEMAGFNKGLSDYTSGLKTMESQTEGAAGKLGGIGNAIGGILAGIVTAAAAAALAIGAAVVAIGGGLAKLAIDAAPIQGVTDAFVNMSDQVGLSLGTLREASAGTITDFELMKQANLALAGAGETLGQRFGSDLPRLLEISRVAARATGQSVDYLFNSLVLGVKRSSPRLIDNTGLVLKLGQSNEVLAAKLGKSVSELTAEEQQIAILDATLAAGAVMMDQFGGATLTNAERLAAMKVSVQNTKDQIGLALQPALEAILVPLGDLAGQYAPMVIAAAEKLGVWLGVNLPIAIQTLSTFWTGTLLPAIQATWAFIQINILPTLQVLWTWLQTNLPIALQALATFWTGTLQPALEAVWSFIQSSVLPILETLWIWLQTNLPVALQLLADFWNNILLPAITAVWNFIDQYVIPLWTALANVVIALLKKEIEALAGLWKNVLEPAIKAVWSVIKTKIFPIFEKLIEKIEGPLADAMTWLKNNVVDPLAGAFQGVAAAIQGVINWLKRAADAIANFQLPAFLTPGSPSPFEYALMGINSELRQLAGFALPKLAASLNVVGGQQVSAPAMMPAQGRGSPTINMTMNPTINNGMDMAMFKAQILQTVNQALAY